MNSGQAKELLQRYNDGLASHEEIQLLHHWYIIESDIQRADPVELDYPGIKQEMWKKIQNERHQMHRGSTWLRIGIAAAVALVVLGAGLFYFGIHNERLQEQLAYINDIAPGKAGATLTLADGKQIRLIAGINGELAKESGVRIVKTAEGQIVYEIKDQPKGQKNSINILSTSRGEQYQVRLPDGSKVWLNSASKLTYPTNFANVAQRTVKLSGEAYFEIYKDKTHPFIVKTDKQDVEVLGTHFNINSYTDEPAIKTTLIEGKVNVRAFNGENQMLKPGEETLLIGGILKVQAANIEEAIAWKDGYFRFNDENIQSVMRKLSRWYDVDVVFDNTKSMVALNGTISRSKTIGQVLKALESTQAIHFKVEGRRVTVMN